MAWRSILVRTVATAVIAVCWEVHARADVVIIANRSRALVPFSITVDGGQKRDYRLDSGDLVPISLPSGGEAAVEFDKGGPRRKYLLTANAPYFFHSDPKTHELDLQRIGLSTDPSAVQTDAARDPPPQPISEPPKAPELTTVTVKLLVDEEEPAVRRLWEERLKKRIAAASEIFQRYARIKLEVVAVDTWKSTEWDPKNTPDPFSKTLSEFEIKVLPQPAQIAIGFTSQFELPKSRMHLGGTRGPFRPHILLREKAHQKISEPERLEVLVHELGHHFGASHSPEANSVMRPVLGDRQSLARSFRIVFDPLNALAINLVGEEIRDGGITSFGRMRPSTRTHLIDIYRTLGRMMPDDPAAGQYLAHLGEFPAVATAPPKKTGSPLIDGTRQVIAAVVDAAARNRRASRGTQIGGATPPQPAGDVLTEQYVRAAAAEAAKLPADDRVKSLCLGLAVALGDVESLKANLVVKDLLSGLETEPQRKLRLSVMGAPTMHGRGDLVRHFVISAAATALAGPDTAESVGLFKEFSDANGGSGFSFADLCADLAGVAFAEHVKSAAGLEAVARSFRVTAYLPPVDKLPEGLKMAQFQATYGSRSDPRFRAEMDKLRERIGTLEAYAAAAPSKP